MATLLLVDDVELFLELERSFLEGSGHRIVTAASGEEALSRMEEVRPDLLLLDLYMPGIDGDEVCRRLRASTTWRALPVIMVTAAGKEEDVQKCLRAGCDDYITKPVSKKDLQEKIHRLLGSVKVRTAPRAPVSLRVQVRSNGTSLQAYARDLSANGIYVKSRAPLELETPVELRLELPDGQVLPVLGKVKRVQEGPEAGMGIYFIHPEPQGREALQRLLSGRNSPLPRPAPAAGREEMPVEARLARLEEQKTRTAEENRRLQERIVELEKENREFAEQFVRTEEVNNNLTNLYIASSRLHSVLDRQQVVEIIKEVVINFVGAEKFALLLFDKEGAELRFEAGEGFEAGEFPAIEPGRGVLGTVARDFQSHFQEGSVVAGSDDPLAPIAAIPLLIHEQAMGVLAVYRLFIQKERFEAVDYQLFSMLAEHAATALFSATLYEESERKRQTYRGFMDLLLK